MFSEGVGLKGIKTVILPRDGQECKVLDHLVLPEILIFITYDDK